MTNEQIAQGWIDEMEADGLTPDEMLEVLKLAREKYRAMLKPCPECLNQVTAGELETFGGLCEDCSTGL